MWVVKVTINIVINSIASKQNNADRKCVYWILRVNTRMTNVTRNTINRLVDIIELRNFMSDLQDQCFMFKLLILQLTQGSMTSKVIVLI